MLFAGDFLASHSAKPENNWQKKMCAISGLNILGLSKNVGHLGLLEKMLLASSTWASTPCLMTWKALGTPQGRLIFQLARLALHITDEGCGLLPTPQAGDERAALTGTQNQLMLSHIAKIWPTPTARCYKGGGGGNNEEGRKESSRYARLACGEPESTWEIEPGMGRVANGVPSRVDRIKALGNAVIPQIPEIIGRAIMSVHNQGEHP